MIRPTPSKSMGLRSGAPARNGKGARPKPALAVPPARGSRFRTLCHVAFRHGFYTGNGFRCPDFAVAPTPDTASLMASLGLVFQDEGDGFGVLIDELRVGDLINYLRLARDPECWSRLSFQMFIVNPEFVSISALPIDADPSAANLYACNSGAHGDGADVMLAPGPFFGWKDRQITTDDDFAVPVKVGATRVVVTDISGREVLSEKVEDSVPPLTQVQVDLGGLPLGLYTVTVEEPEPPPPCTRLYNSAPRIPFCFLDLLFTRPRPDMAGIYPVPSLDGPVAPETVGEVHYTLRFAARRTQWQYYVVSQSPDSVLSDLTITGGEVGFVSEPEPVLLPSGQLATLLAADAELPLRQRSPERLRLRGRRRRADGQESEVRIDCLPVAPATPVWPGHGAESGISEMFVYV